MISKKIVIGLFCAALLAPNAASLAGQGNGFAINENRIRLEFPGMAALARPDGFQEFNSWYNDNFGMRDLLIRLQHQIDYSLFRYSKTLFFSNDRNSPYLFYRSVMAEEQIANEQMAEETKLRIVENIQRVKDFLEERGIAFKFMIPPQKNELLQAQSSSIPVRRPSRNAYYDMEARFETGSLSDSYVSILEPLMRYNEKMPVFCYSDFHWNDWGAACAFGEVMNAYGRDRGLDRVYDADSLEFVSFQPDVNFAQLSNLSVLRYSAPAEISAGIGEIDSGEFPLEGYPAIFCAWENPVSPVFGGAVLFIGDSYTPPALYGFNNTFSGITDLFRHTYFCHWNDAQDILHHMPEDVELVVMECIESNYFYMDSIVEKLYTEAQ